VTYEPAAGSDFQGERTKLAGRVAKTATTAPANPVLSPQTNTERGSTLNITNAVAGAWYIPVRYDSSADTRPELAMESAAQAAGWKQADGTELELSGLDANTDYMVYGACLETGTKAASQLSTSAKTRTLKEEITAGAADSGSTGLTGPAQLKAMDGEGTPVSIAVYGKAPTGTWHWYVSKTAEGAGDGWKIIRTETHEEAADAAQASDIYKIPYEYSGYYLKVEFWASGDYTGKEIYQPSVAIADRELTGSVAISPDSAGGNQRLFEKLTASYTGTDDGNGTWTWQRREADNSWSNLSAELYTAAGPESSYTPTERDFGRMLKAVYQAGSFGCTGSKEAETGAIGKAVQNQPAAP